LLHLYFYKQIKKNNIEALPRVEVPERMGTFCEGCPHTGSYYSIDQVLKEVDGIIGGDIGCSSLPPFRADWLLCMNSGIGIYQGMAQMVEKQTVLSTGGDGSFFHAGALSLLSAIQNKIDLIHLVFDNGTIAMTGHQESPSGKNFDHHQFLLGMGVDRVIDVIAYQPIDFAKKLKEELNETGVRVFWVKGTCVIKGNEYIESRRNDIYPELDSSKCGSCSKCYKELACPAILNLGDNLQQNLTIDLTRCVRCGVCHEICPNEAITIKPMIS
jgi:indolepyruvate ferredoxin oxidoreductase alpha subunit